MYRERIDAVSHTKSIPVDIDEYRILCQFCVELISKCFKKNKFIDFIDYEILIECLNAHNPDGDLLPFVTPGGDRP